MANLRSLLLIVFFLALAFGSSLGDSKVSIVLSYPDTAGLELILTHWPGLANLSLLPWRGNATGACGGWYGIACNPAAYGWSVYELDLDNVAGPENATDVLPYMEPWLPNLNTLKFTAMNVSLAAQGALFLPSVVDLEITSSTVTTIADVSNLTSLYRVVISNNPNLTSVPAFPQSGQLSYVTYTNNPLVSSIQGIWPWSIYELTLSNMPLLSTVPSFASCTILSYLQVTKLGLTSFPAPPSSSCILNYFAVTDTPTIPSIGAGYAACPINTLSLDPIPLLGNNVPAFNGSLINMLTLSVGLTSVPGWVCNMSGSSSNPIQIKFGRNNLTSFATCVFAIPYLQSLSVIGSGDTLSSIPNVISNTLSTLVLQQLPALNLSPGAVWNLPSLSYLVTPPQFLVRNVLTTSSVISDYNNIGGFELDIFDTSTDKLDDSAFLAFPNIVNWNAPNVGFTGTLPSSLLNATWINYILLSGNNFTGNLPRAIVDLPNLYTIDLTNNHMTGLLPNFTGSFPSAGGYPEIDLSGNLFDLCNSPAMPISTSTSPWSPSPCSIGGLCDTCAPPVFSTCTVTCSYSPPPVPQVAPAPAALHPAPSTTPTATPSSGPTSPSSSPAVSSPTPTASHPSSSGPASNPSSGPFSIPTLAHTPSGAAQLFYGQFPVLLLALLCLVVLQ